MHSSCSKFSTRWNNRRLVG